MRYLIVSDLHGNWEALQAVLEDAAGRYDEVICLGDLVGYCADPGRVVEWARAHVQTIVRGNHDKACAGLEDLEWFNPVARLAANWTMEALGPEGIEYLRQLPKGPITIGEFEIFHGSPLDEDEYVVSAYDAGHLVEYLQKPVGFFGHTHLQGGFMRNRNGVRRLERPDRSTSCRVLILDPNSLYMVNPGSLGQPRDGDPRSAYAIFEPGSRAVEYRRVAYDVKACQAKILEAGLPELLAFRLEMGS